MYAPILLIGPIAANYSILSLSRKFVGKDYIIYFKVLLSNSVINGLLSFCNLNIRFFDFKG